MRNIQINTIKIKNEKRLLIRAIKQRKKFKESNKRLISLIIFLGDNNTTHEISIKNAPEKF